MIFSFVGAESVPQPGPLPGSVGVVPGGGSARESKVAEFYAEPRLGGSFGGAGVVGGTGGMSRAVDASAGPSGVVPGQKDALTGMALREARSEQQELVASSTVYGADFMEPEVGEEDSKFFWSRRWEIPNCGFLKSGPQFGKIVIGFAIGESKGGGYLAMVR